MRVTIYGAGYVGLVTAVCLAEMGHEVLCLDVDIQKVEQLNRGVLPIYEAGLEELLHRNQISKRLLFTSIPSRAVDHAEIHMIAVGTPSRADGSVNLDDIDTIARTIGQYRKAPCIVVNKSTVPPGTAERVHRLIGETASNLGTTCHVTLVSNPEFLQEGSAVKQCLNPDRILVGTDSVEATEVMRQLYQPLLANRPELLILTSIRSAELAKYAANALLATKISFINEISQIAERVGADIEEVKQGIALDYRINPAFLNAGCGFGGSCFPKDLAGLEQIAHANQFEPHLISAVIKRNNLQQRLLFNKLEVFFNQRLEGKKIAVWGLAFKPGTDDIRSASSRVLIDALIKARAKIQAYDPLAMQAMATHYRERNSQLDFSDSALTALENADALVLVTEWPEFKSISLDKIYQRMKQPVIFDGRNLFNPIDVVKAGFYYSGIGRNVHHDKVQLNVDLCI